MFRKVSAWLLYSTIIFSPAVWAQDAPLQAIQEPLAPLPQNSPKITLQNALEKALTDSPRLKAAGAVMNASRGEQQQAGLLPNPELGIEAENIAGQGSYRGFDSAEITYGLSQKVEIGGKRSARQRAADQAYAVASSEYQMARLDLIRDVTIAYAEAVAAKEGVALAEKQKSLANEVLKNVAQRVNAAAEPLFQKSKAEVALATSEMALDKARLDYTIARKQLAVLWGSEDTNYELDSSQFFDVNAPRILPQDRGITDSPALIRSQSEVERRRALYELEKANAIPDPTFSAGVRDFRASGEQAFVVGLSLPMPLFDRNQGNIARAGSEVTRSISEKRSAEITLAADLIRTQQELENAYRRAKSLENDILPAAEKAYTLSRQGYGAGKFPYLEVLDAQRTLVEARAQYNDVIKNYHIKRAEFERLTATYRTSPDEKDNAHAE